MQKTTHSITRVVFFMKFAKIWAKNIKNQQKILFLINKTLEFAYIV